MNDQGVSDDTAVRLRGVISRLSRQLNASAAGEGLTPSQASVLSLVTKRGPLSLTDLAALEGLNPTMVSRIVGRLDELGLIRRVPNSNDLRSASVQITDQGERVTRDIMANRAAVVAACLAELSADRRAALLAALPALEELAEALIRQRAS